MESNENKRLNLRKIKEQKQMSGTRRIQQRARSSSLLNHTQPASPRYCGHPEDIGVLYSWATLKPLKHSEGAREDNGHGVRRNTNKAGCRAQVAAYLVIVKYASIVHDVVK